MKKKKLQTLVKVFTMTLALSVTGGTFATPLFTVNAQEESSSQSSDLSRYSIEGFATAQSVTGGGEIDETSTNYFKVSSAEEFLSALKNVSSSKEASVIELTSDIALGSKEIGSLLSTYSNVISASKNQPLLHPTLLKTGVSQVDLKSMNNLTIFSENGAKITHACFNISASSNIIIRNITFDEIWEWDENTSGDYDRNDWDYITIQGKSTGIWIDHCTFYKAYDGIVDVKKAPADSTTDVTISWCKFLPGSEGSFFDDMMDVLEANPTQYPYYNKLITTYKMTKDQVRQYANAQKKTHLIGASDSEENISNLRVTLANNYYKNTMDRLPRLRGGYAHVYNCIMDSSDLYTLRNSLSSSSAKSKIVSNGAISTCGASVLMENTFINGIENALLSGNGNSSAGYIGSVNSLYYINGQQKELTVTNKTSSELVLDIAAFKAALPYDSYTLYDASDLENRVLPFVGAGSVTMSANEWLKTVYETTEDSNDGAIDDSKDETTDDSKDEATDDSKDETTDDSNDEVTDDSKDETSGDTTEDTTEEVSCIHNFTTSGKESSFYTITGNLSSSKGTVTYDGLTLTSSLKMESSTKVTFTTTEEATTTLVFNADCNKSVSIDGVTYKAVNGILEVELAAGTHTVSKEDSNVNLYYINTVVK